MSDPRPLTDQSAFPGVYQRGSFEEWVEKHGVSVATQVELLHVAVEGVSAERDCYREKLEAVGRWLSSGNFAGWEMVIREIEAVLDEGDR